LVASIFEDVSPRLNLEVYHGFHFVCLSLTSGNRPVGCNSLLRVQYGSIRVIMSTHYYHLFHNYFPCQNLNKMNENQSSPLPGIDLLQELPLIGLQHAYAYTERRIRSFAGFTTVAIQGHTTG
jgi:hypothetical protein